MMKTIAIGVAAIAALSGCTTMPSMPPPTGTPLLTPVDALRSPDVYDGKVVSIEGYALVGPEVRFLLQTKADADLTMRELESRCVTLMNSGLIIHDKAKYNERRLRVTGRFLADYPAHNIVQFGSCSKSAIDMDNNYRIEVLE